MSRQPLNYIPIAVSFSDIERGGEDSEEPIEFGAEDRALLDTIKEESLLFVLKTLPKDRYRVVVLMLFLNQLGYHFRYQDIADIWGQNKVAVHQTIKRLRRALAHAGIRDGSDLQQQAQQTATAETQKKSLAQWHYSALRRKPTSSSGFKGVSVRGRRFRAEIKVQGKRLNLGLFDRAEDAARAYDRAVLKHFGTGAYRNFGRGEEGER